MKDINLSFDDYGLTSIVGKSGSGKTTLINLITRIDYPTEGEIIFNKQRYKRKNTKSYKFYRNDIGVVFQQFDLIDDRSVIYNVALPLLIRGYRKSKAYMKAKSLLEYVQIPKELYESPCNKLSGGEAQRVAIARAIIGNPKIILCDEPTGSLDSDNSKRIMELLSNISKTRLVIMVSHNLQIVKEYSDRIIELSDGKVINDYRNKKVCRLDEIKQKLVEGKRDWTFSFSLKNFKKRIKRNLFVISSLIVSFLMTNIVVGFICGKDDSTQKACFNQLDFGVGYISSDEVVNDTGVLKLTKSVRPDLNELLNDAKISTLFEICPNFTAILPQNIRISYDGNYINGLNYSPIYSYSEQFIDSSLISKGNLPNSDSLFEVIINDKCYRKLKKILHKDPLNETIDISNRVEVNYVVDSNEYISDVFLYNVEAKIVAVTKELNYLQDVKVYYSYSALQEHLQEYALDNLSTYFASKITWYDRVALAENYSYISSYSYQLFLKDYHYRNYLLNKKIIPGEYTFTSSSLIISNSLISFLNVAKYALILFLAVSVIGAILILSIVSFTNYSEDRKISAILTVLGAKNDSIQDIYLNESMMAGLISLIIGFVLSSPLSILVNKLISKLVPLVNPIRIPFASFLNIPFFYPIILVVATLLLVSIATLIPISFSKNNSLKLELKSND